MDESFSPVIVGGCQRSGSTMLGAMLGAHPDVIALPEAQFTADLAPEDPQQILPLAQYVDLIEEHERFQIWDYPLNGDRPEGEGSFADAIRWLAARYGADNERPSPKFWVDHQPGHVRYLARLKEHFPKLKFIHLVRDGRAVAASIMPLDWGPNSINRAAWFWQQRLAFGFAAERWFAEEDRIFLRYEDIVDDPKAALTPVCEMLGLEWRDEMAGGAGLKTPEFTKNQHSLVGSPAQSSRKEAWRKKLSEREIEIFEAINADMLTYLGYEPAAGARPSGMSGKESVRLDLENVVKKYRNVIAFRRRVREHVK